MRDDARPCVVLIHGLGRSRLSMLALASRLEAAGFRCHRIGYPSRRLSLREATKELAAELARLAEGAPVHLVGHSLGGVIALCLRQSRPDLHIRRVVQLGSPNRGSGMARALSRFAPTRLLFGPVLSELAKTPCPPAPRDPQVAAIAGTGIPSAITRIYGVCGPNDGLVTLRSAWGFAAGCRIRISALHGWLPFSAAAARHTARFLKTGACADDR